MFIAIDDHSRVAYTAVHADERKESAVAFLHAAYAYYCKLGVRVQRLITDNGPAFHSHAFGDVAMPARH